MPTAALQRAPQRRAQSRRIEALDALRGLAIALMIFVNNPGDHDAMPSQFVHADWHGFRVAELVFPLFLFSAGISMALSRRSGAGRPMLRRTLLLVGIGCVLVSVKYRHLAPSTGTLQLIAGASLLAWMARRWFSRRAQAVAAVIVLGGFWIGFAITGWDPGTNLAAVVDAHLIGAPSDLGVLGIVSAAFIVLAGGWVGDLVLSAPTAMARAAWAARAGLAATALGLALAVAIPLNKRIWTPSYVVLGTSLAATTVLAPIQVPVFEWAAGAITPAGAAIAWASAMLLAGYALCRVLQRRQIFVRL
jgi:predicted acyltransferase